MAIQRPFTAAASPGPTIDARVLHGDVQTVEPMRQGWFGVMVCAIPLASPQAVAVGQHAGLLVERVAKGSPAHRASIRANDVLLRVNGTAVTYDGSLRVALTGRRHGEPVIVRLMRDGRERDVRVVVQAVH